MRSQFSARRLSWWDAPTTTISRLIVCRNPLLAAERQRKSDELLAATEKGPRAR